MSSPDVTARERFTIARYAIPDAELFSFALPRNGEPYAVEGAPFGPPTLLVRIDLASRIGDLRRVCFCTGSTEHRGEFAGLQRLGTVEREVGDGHWEGIDVYVLPQEGDA